MIYIFITFFLFSLRFILRNDIRARLNIYFIIFFALFLFSTFRYQVGCDWGGYLNMFKDVSSWDLLKTINTRDPLSNIIFYIVSKVGLPYPYVYIPFGIIFFWGIHILARRQPDPFSFLLLLFPILIINMGMSGIRQAAAIGVICIALTAFIDRRPIFFVLWVILAFTFHSSAIIFLLLLPFVIGKLNNINFFLAVLLSFPVIILLLSTDSAKYAMNVYVGTIREANGAFYRTGVLAMSAVYFFLFVKNKWLEKFPNDYSIIYLGSLAMIGTLFLTLISTIIGDRFGYYFIPIQAIIFSRLPYLTFKRQKAFHIAAPFIGLFIILCIWIKASWAYGHCYAPYNNWIFGLNSNIF
jgi:hypothetical protein